MRALVLSAFIFAFVSQGQAAPNAQALEAMVGRMLNGHERAEILGATPHGDLCEISVQKLDQSITFVVRSSFPSGSIVETLTPKIVGLQVVAYETKDNSVTEKSFAMFNVDSHPVHLDFIKSVSSNEVAGELTSWTGGQCDLKKLIYEDAPAHGPESYILLK